MAAALVVAECPYSPPVRDSGPAEVRPVPAAALGGPGDMAKLPLFRLIQGQLHLKLSFNVQKASQRLSQCPHN